MSLRAKIEAVIYAAEEPVSLSQLSAIFAAELPPPTSEAQEIRGGESPEGLFLEEGILQAASVLATDAIRLAEMANGTGAEQLSSEIQASPGAAVAQPSEADLRREARQRERRVREQIKALVDEMIQEYESADRGMEIREVAGGYRVATKPEYHDAVRAFVKSLKPPMKLSLQALETLAVIAYKQPVTAPEVAEIRGVDSGGVLGSLISRKLITTAGRKQVIGRPILYKTTREFLLRFGLKDISELPSIEEFEKLAGDIEIGEEERPEMSSGSREDQLPFREGMDAGLDAFEANAGEAGLAVEPAKEATTAEEISPEIAFPEITPLNASILNSPEPENVEVVSAAHPTVAIEENDGQTS